MVKKIIFSAFVLLCLCTNAQEKKPKVALVLSGGGAKGIAHIPTLQVLDSLNIVPDLIIGTSMGSIVGALYASGYSADSIAAISNNTNWTQLFSSEIPITAVSNEEKSEYKQYLTEIEWTNNHFRRKSAIVSDKNVKSFFNKYTHPVHDIQNFDSLPIPFRAIAVDIVNGKEIILKEGELDFAMRASMSIPAVFKPMNYKDVLLVDGGVLNNFPTDIAQNMGADIIIGSDVGGGMEPIEKLDNPVTVVFQAAMLASNLKVPANKARCDVLIDHTKHLSYSTENFNKSKQIFEEGKLATAANMDALVALAKKLQKYTQKEVSLPKKATEIYIDSIVIQGVSKQNIDLLNARLRLSSKKYYTLAAIEQAMDNAYGTNLFESVTNSFVKKNDRQILTIEVVEKSKNIFKASIHFDNLFGIGLLLNYTGRNLLGKSSRLMATLDIASDFRYRAQYQKNIGKEKNWWFRSDFYGENKDQRTYFAGKHSGDFKTNHLQFDNSLNLNINAFKNYISAGAIFDLNIMKPKIDPNISGNFYNLVYYNYRNASIYVKYQNNTIDKVFFATKGSRLQLRLSSSIYNFVEATSINEAETPSFSGAIPHFSKFSISFEKRIPISLKTTSIITLNSGLTFAENKSTFIANAPYSYSAGYFLGGNITRPRNDTFVLPGLHEMELSVPQFTMLALKFQYMPFNNFYFSPHGHIGSVGFYGFDEYIKNMFNPQGKWTQYTNTSLLTTIGLTTSYKSFLGPINFDMSWANNTPGTRFYFGLGYHFTPAF